MALPRFHKLDLDKRELLLDAAMEEFAEHGFEQASINRIIERAGTSKGSMYYYFEHKEDLFMTVIAHGSEQIGHGMDIEGLTARLESETLSAAEFWPQLEAISKRSSPTPSHSTSYSMHSITLRASATCQQSISCWMKLQTFPTPLKNSTWAICSRSWRSLALVVFSNRSGFQRVSEPTRRRTLLAAA